MTKKQKTNKNCPWSLIYVCDCYVTLQEMCYKDYPRVVTPGPGDLDNDLEEWCNAYKQR